MADPTVVTLMDVYTAAKTLSREDKVRLGEMLRDHLQREAGMEFGPGDKVKFTTRHGVQIEGTVLRLTGKNVKLAASKDQYGTPTQRPVTWTVSRQLVVPA